MQTLNDIAREEQRIRETDDLDVEHELKNTVFPLLKALAGECTSTFGDVAAAMEEILEDEDYDDDFDDDGGASDTLIDRNFALAVADTLRLGVKLLDEKCPDEDVVPESEFGAQLLAYYEASNKLTALIEQAFIVDELENVPELEVEFPEDNDDDLIDEDPDADES